jgi:nucleotide-binding universal stress UspA family protein
MTSGGAPLALYCFDGSPDAREAIARGAALLAGHEAVVMCIFESILQMPSGGDFPYPDMMPAADADEVDDAAKGRAAAMAEEGCEILRAAGVPASPAAVEGVGAVWRTILAEADDRDAAIVVLGSRGITGVRSLVLGSVSHGVANHCRRPVLIIPAAAD